MLTPSYLISNDYPWLRALLDERARFEGRRRREWQARQSEPFPLAASATKMRIALDVLDRAAPDRNVARGLPRRVRAAVFRAAAQDPDRRRALEAAARALGLTVEAVRDALLADLPNERALAALPAGLHPAELALMCNEALVAGLLQRARRVHVHVRGEVRAVIRHAKLMGLLCAATPSEDKDGVVLDISGPYALFRHTRIYGRALSSLIPRLAWCHHYRLEAECSRGTQGDLGRSPLAASEHMFRSSPLAASEHTFRLVLSSGDPLTPARELPAFDSQVEERFARTFAKLAPDWEVVREPAAIALGDRLTYPDFELRHRATGAQWLLEIVGYWTPDYLAKKLAGLHAAKLEKLVICVDEQLRCGDGELAAWAHVVRYRRHVDARAVLAIVDPLGFARLPPTKKTRKPRPALGR